MVLIFIQMFPCSDSCRILLDRFWECVNIFLNYWPPAFGGDKLRLICDLCAKIRVEVLFLLFEQTLVGMALRWNMAKKIKSFKTAKLFVLAIMIYCLVLKTLIHLVKLGCKKLSLQYKLNLMLNVLEILTTHFTCFSRIEV